MLNQKAKRRRCAQAAAVASAILFATSGTGQPDVPVIAVGGVESPYRSLDEATIQTTIESALTRTRKFRLMERARLATLLEERGLSVSGIADGTASYGGFGGVDYLLTARVMEATIGSGAGTSIPIFRSFGGGGCNATVGLDMRVVDVDTGEIRFSESLAAADKISINYPEGADYGNPCRYAKDGQQEAALDAAANDAAVALVGKITMAIFPIRVSRVVGNQVYLNYGSTFLSRGNYLKVVTLGEGFVDPDTGEVLGADEEEVGYVAVSETHDKYSIADVVYATRHFEVRDVARQLRRSEAKAVQRMVAQIERDRKKRAKACSRGEKNRDKHCERDSESSRCRRALAEVEENC